MNDRFASDGSLLSRALPASATVLLLPLPARSPLFVTTAQPIYEERRG
jgi:hypothetical protein